MTESEERLNEDDLASIKATMDAMMMSWIDQSIPALSGKTPRQCAKTTKGADKVRTMILAMPASLAPNGKKIEPPREAMLRELGL